MPNESPERPDERGRGPIGPGEIGILVFILVILAALAVGERTGMQSRVAVRAAQARFMDLHEEGRAIARARGVPVQLLADPDRQMVTLEEGCTGQGRVLESRDFQLSFRVDMRTTGEALRLCMTPGGTAVPAGYVRQQEERLTFFRGEHSASLVFFADVGERP